MTDTISRPMDSGPAMEDPDRLAGRMMQKAWNRDGVPEIAIGIFFLFMSAIFGAQHLLEKEWPVFRVLPAAIVLIGPLAFLMPHAVKWTRNRYLIERTGYVVEKPPIVKGRLRATLITVFIAVVAVIAVVVAIRNLAPFPSRWIVAGAGVFCGVLLPVCGRALRFVFIGAAVAATGILLGIYDADFGIGWTILYGAGGAITLISGTTVLLRFLAETREAGD